MNENQEEDIHQLQRFFSDAGKAYLSSGGPTTRFEDLVSELGESYQLSTEAYATSTGVFVSSRVSESSIPFTSMTRVRRSSTKLSDLIEIERTFEKLKSRELAIPVAVERAVELDRAGTTYTPQLLLALFAMGFAASFPLFQNLIGSILCGVLTILISWLSGPVADRWRLGSIFGEFFASLLNWGLSFCLGFLLSIPVESIAIGGLLLLVPGLTLTTAISELAEQNLLSGTAKLMRGVLTLLALGASYFLFNDCLVFLGFSESQQVLPSLLNHSSFLIQTLFYLLLVSSFSLIFCVPLMHVPLAVVTGLSSWLIFQTFEANSYVILNHFAPAFAVGFISLLFSRMTKVPSQTYSVPGILALVPGMLALSSFSTAQTEVDNTLFYQVVIILSGIVFGLLSARVPVLLYNRKVENHS